MCIIRIRDWMRYRKFANSINFSVAQLRMRLNKNIKHKCRYVRISTQTCEIMFIKLSVIYNVNWVTGVQNFKKMSFKFRFLYISVYAKIIWIELYMYNECYVYIINLSWMRMWRNMIGGACNITGHKHSPLIHSHPCCPFELLI